MVAPTACWYPSRDAALKKLAAFLPGAGRDYAAQRNHDNGRGRHTSVSCLSPWLRHRCIGEWEVVLEVLRVHSPTAADKFIQEVCWRTYWKGWLEMRPTVWQNYLSEVGNCYRDAEVMQRMEEMVSGQSGIECFDAWCDELISTGYLHNHARMWFASIWVFTLKLPWQLGADFFIRHLLDGDPASNTLSWRWVAGLQTKGKAYLARADNIAKYTGNRFTPHGQLISNAGPLTEAVVYDRHPLPDLSDRVPSGRNGLLLTDDDLHPQPLPGATDYLSVSAVTALACISPGTVAARVLAFNRQLIEDAGNWSGLSSDNIYSCSTDNDVERVVAALTAWATKHRLERVVCVCVPVGPNATLVQALHTALAEAGIKLHPVRRPWDTRFWPHAGRGFFALKKKIPALLQELRDGASGLQNPQPAR